MAVTDPVDARLLAALADVGKVAVHELAARLGLDPRDVAYRLVNLSAAGLPLLVGVESDPQGLRAVLAAAGWAGPHTAPPGPAHGTPSAAHPAQGTPSGAYPVRGTPSAPHSAQGTPSGAYPVHGVPSGTYPVQGTPSGTYPVHGTPSGAHTVQGSPSARHLSQAPTQFVRAPQPPAASPPAPDPAMNTWGPPQSAQWARGDRQTAPATPPAARSGRTGDVLETQGSEGEPLAVQLLEVQDPADYLFGAAGYRLDEGERAIVVHTEVANRGTTPYDGLPDNYLELVTDDGRPVAKAPVSLTSRPPHRIGVQPGETSGGHTVYVIPEATRIAGVRWSPRPEPDDRTLTWTVAD